MLNKYHLLHIHYRCSIYPSSEGPESLYSLEEQESSSAEADEDVTTNNIHARTLLGAGKIDLFQTSPVRANQSRSELLDHCMSLHVPGWTSKYLQLCGPAQLTDSRPYCHACNAHRRTLSEAHSHRYVPRCHLSPGIDTRCGYACIEESGLPPPVKGIATYA